MEKFLTTCTRSKHEYGEYSRYKGYVGFEEYVAREHPPLPRVKRLDLSKLEEMYCLRVEFDRPIVVRIGRKLGNRSVRVRVYDPVSLTSFFGRFERELDIFEELKYGENCQVTDDDDGAESLEQRTQAPARPSRTLVPEKVLRAYAEHLCVKPRLMITLNVKNARVIKDRVYPESMLIWVRDEMKRCLEELSRCDACSQE